MLRCTHFDDVPIKPQRVYEEMNKAFGKETCYVNTIGLSQIAAAQFLHVYRSRHRINCGQAGLLGWTVPVEIILERATNIAMGAEIDKVTEFEGMAKETADAPTAIALLD